MDEHDWLTERFEEHRAHRRAVAYRLLGSPRGADDAVQEAWLRLGRSDISGVANLGGWLATVVARVCLDLLRAQGAARRAAGCARPRAERGPRGRDGPRARSALGRLGRSRAAGG